MTTPYEQGQLDGARRASQWHELGWETYTEFLENDRIEYQDGINSLDRLSASEAVKQTEYLDGWKAGIQSRCSTCGGKRNYAINTVLQEQCYDCANKEV
jgi:hypothetical protein